ncbi:MAG: hypothetical protein ACRD7E_17215, partial [Bryobacteraceae bacterium]
MAELRPVMPLLWAAGRFALSLLIIGFATTCLLRFAPGFGVDERELDYRLSNESIEELRNAAGNENVFIRYYRFLRDAAGGDIVYSTSLNRPVSELIRQRYATSIRILAVGLAVGWLSAFLLAAAGTVSQARIVPFVGTVAGALILCVPSALLAYLCYLARSPVVLIVSLIIFARAFRVTDNLFGSARN